MKIIDSNYFEVMITEEKQSKEIKIINEAELNFVCMLKPILSDKYGIEFYEQVLTTFRNNRINYYIVANEIYKAVDLDGNIEYDKLSKKTSKLFRGKKLLV